MFSMMSTLSCDSSSTYDTSNLFVPPPKNLKSIPDDNSHESLTETNCCGSRHRQLEYECGGNPFKAAKLSNLTREESISHFPRWFKSRSLLKDGEQLLGSQIRSPINQSSRAKQSINSRLNLHEPFPLYSNQINDNDYLSLLAMNEGEGFQDFTSGLPSNLSDAQTVMRPVCVVKPVVRGERLGKKESAPCAKDEPVLHLHQAHYDIPKPVYTNTSTKLDLILSLNYSIVQKAAWYYPTFGAQDAKVRLNRCVQGTFLLRDSSTGLFPFALSLRTSRGTTSMRVAYKFGRFYFDCDSTQLSLVPKFESVVALIQFFMQRSIISISTDMSEPCGNSRLRNERGVRQERGGGTKCVFLEESGRMDTPIVVTRPYNERVEDLRAICRKVVHRHRLSSQCTDQKLKKYLDEYPHEF